MVKSMTGYGRARRSCVIRDITVEVRSVNNRYLDCTVKMPRMYAFAEDAVKKHGCRRRFPGERWTYSSPWTPRRRMWSRSAVQPGAGGPAMPPPCRELADVCGTDGLSA